MFRNTPLPLGRQRDTLSEFKVASLWSDLGLETFDARERLEPCTPMLAQQFQHVIWHAVVVLSDTGDLPGNPCFCFRQAKREEVLHQEILDHPHLLDVEMEGKGNHYYDLAENPPESQRSEADVLF